ncbi:MAG TPA: hypothetical protein VGQ59_16195 [Cyclobacteriaceae bacterium]|jgi:hypothetical protein|nr:hypothetical protein [Cyclobacteriaceae bacterium]
MKSNFIFLALAFGIGSCLNDDISSKSSNNKIDTVALILGKWTVEKDSFFIGSAGVNKMKTDSDYYDFEQDGLLLIKEGTKIDTATYELKAENDIYISFNSKGKITVYTPNENYILVQGETIINRISGNYLINNFSDSSIKISITSILSPPSIAEEGDVKFKLRAAITLKR